MPQKRRGWARKSEVKKNYNEVVIFRVESVIELKRNNGSVKLSMTRTRKKNKQNPR